MQISEYNTPEAEKKGVKGLMIIIAKNITIEGFLVFQPQFGPAYFAEHQENVQKWISEGSFKPKNHVTDLDKAPEAMLGMLKGENFGKAVIRIKQ
jgi:NADPH-dependent curcumin reductase CurA